MTRIVINKSQTMSNASLLKENKILESSECWTNNYDFFYCPHHYAINYIYSIFSPFIEMFPSSFKNKFLFSKSLTCERNAQQWKPLRDWKSKHKRIFLWKIFLDFVEMFFFRYFTEFFILIRVSISSENFFFYQRKKNFQVSS